MIIVSRRHVAFKHRLHRLHGVILYTFDSTCTTKTRAFSQEKKKPSSKEGNEHLRFKIQPPASQILPIRKQYIRSLVFIYLLRRYSMFLTEHAYMPACQRFRWAARSCCWIKSWCWEVVCHPKHVFENVSPEKCVVWCREIHTSKNHIGSMWYLHPYAIIHTKYIV